MVSPKSRLMKEKKLHSVDDCAKILGQKGGMAFAKEFKRLKKLEKKFKKAKGK